MFDRKNIPNKQISQIKHQDFEELGPTAKKARRSIKYTTIRVFTDPCSPV